MTAFNVVRFRGKPGREEDFVDGHRQVDRGSLIGFKRGALIKAGDRLYRFIGEWDDFSSIENGRESMIEILDGFRDMLKDLGDGLGVSDPVKVEVVVEIEQSARTPRILNIRG